MFLAEFLAFLAGSPEMLFCTVPDAAPRHTLFLVWASAISTISDAFDTSELCP